MKKPTVELKRFIVRKYIMARSAMDAIKQDSKSPVDDVWVDEAWKEQQRQQLMPLIGFDAPKEE